LPHGLSWRQDHTSSASRALLAKGLTKISLNLRESFLPLVNSVNKNIKSNNNGAIAAWNSLPDGDNLPGLQMTPSCSALPCWISSYNNYLFWTAVQLLVRPLSISHHPTL
jgi:hypothetical protein